MLKIAVCVSGGGTNLQAIIDSVADGRITNAEIVRVISNKPGVKALDRAEKAGIPSAVVSRKDYADKESFNRALLSAIDEAQPDLIVLAGFLVVLPEELVKKYTNRIINVHPSLIPSFCGVGFYGLRVHEEALKRGVKVTGATVHFVDEGCDSGPIIMQKAVEIQKDDTPESLQLRVMEQAEWIIMPKAIDLIANGKVTVENRRVIVED
ncbi:formyltetrahydrofolate-dependent phosphoribosylglycinamide formyltransferase [Lachnospiraceae bacterium]|nr:formyltetrahydrofolate-dependent phosphoribosylglycinamide formyltransferase [Lachnospiraceae bacterium]